MVLENITKKNSTKKKPKFFSLKKQHENSTKKNRYGFSNAAESYTGHGGGVFNSATVYHFDTAF